MKKIFYLIGCVLISLNAYSQKDIKTVNDSAMMVFTDTIHDFGTIKEADGKVSHVFEFTNEGKQPLVVLDARASCGCTIPEWTKTPIETGKGGMIEVTFNPARRAGVFEKTITITSNSVGQINRVHIKGTIEPSLSSNVKHFTHKFTRNFRTSDIIIGVFGIIVITIGLFMFFGQKKKSKNDKFVDISNEKDDSNENED